jgi:hypothetical protein
MSHQTKIMIIKKLRFLAEGFRQIFLIIMDTRPLRALLSPHATVAQDELYQVLHTNTIPNTILDKKCWAIPIPNTYTIPNLNPQSKLIWSAESPHLQTSPPTPQKSYTKFRNPRPTFENTPLSAQKCHSSEGMGAPRIFCGVVIIIFLWVRSPSKISESYDNFCKYPHCPPKNVIFFWIGILIFLLVRSPYKFSEPYENPFCEN